MTKPMYALDYRACTVKELRLFLKARHISLRGLNRKYMLTEALYDADKLNTFRFLQLPAEMRNLVYELLLTLTSESPERRRSRKGLVCYPQILATSSQMWKEATGLLYALNTIKCMCAVETRLPGTNPSVKRTVQIHTTSTSVRLIHGSVLSLPDGITHYPGFLRRIENLQITLDYRVLPSANQSDVNSETLNHFLFTLSSFLSDSAGNRLVHLELIFRGTTLSTTRCKKLIYPVARLLKSERVGITVHGHADAAILQDFLYWPVHILSQDMSTLTQAATTFREGEAFLALLESLNGPQGIPNLILNAKRHLGFERLLRIIRHSGFDLDTEDNFAMGVAAMQRKMDHVQDDRVENMMLRWKATRSPTQG
ncbi:hypothetical protein LTR66_006654 [Elasticomyces elasticus]|nr:hypothetical protein LTR66_006654 [Elasticomyces elasticus]